MRAFTWKTLCIVDDMFESSQSDSCRYSLSFEITLNDWTSKKVIQRLMLKTAQVRPLTDKLTEDMSSTYNSARPSALFLSAVAALTSLGSTGAPGLAHATRIGIGRSSRLGTRGEAGLSAWS